MIDVSTKVAMIFDIFNKDRDQYLNEVEFTLWQSVLQKPEPFEDSWESIINFYEMNFRCNININKGITEKNFASVK